MHSSVNFLSLLHVFSNLFLSIIFQLAQPPPASLLALHQCLFIFPTRPTRNSKNGSGCDKFHKACITSHHCKPFTAKHVPWEDVIFLFSTTTVMNYTSQYWWKGIRFNIHTHTRTHARTHARTHTQNTIVIII